MSEKVVKEGSANADLKADVQNDQQSDVQIDSNDQQSDVKIDSNDQQADVKIDSNDQQADCGKRGFRVQQRGSRQKKKLELLRLPFIPLKDLKPYLKLN